MTSASKRAAVAECCDGKICLAVDGKVIRKNPLHEHGGVGQAVAVKPLLKLNWVFEIRGWLGRRILRSHDERPVEPQRLLPVRPRMRMIKIGACWPTGYS